MAKRAPSKTSFVPRIVFTTALTTTAVIPLCACGGEVAGVHPQGNDAGQIEYSVGTAFFDSGISPVAIEAFDASDDVFASVAACAFDASDGDCIGFTVGVQAFDASTDALSDSVAAFGFDASDDAPVLGVALGGFDASTDAPVFGVAIGAFDASADSAPTPGGPGKHG
jgi:hypothetical protein